jgi:hypothetical protein
MPPTPKQAELFALAEPEDPMAPLLVELIGCIGWAIRNREMTDIYSLFGGETSAPGALARQCLYAIKDLHRSAEWAAVEERIDKALRRASKLQIEEARDIFRRLGAPVGHSEPGLGHS